MSSRRWRSMTGRTGCACASTASGTRRAWSRAASHPSTRCCSADVRPSCARWGPAGGGPGLAPMAGGGVEVYATAGDAVAEGDVLMLIEAMKMNNELRAQREGTVREGHVQVGQRVEAGVWRLVLGL